MNSPERGKVGGYGKGSRRFPRGSFALRQLGGKRSQRATPPRPFCSGSIPDGEKEAGDSGGARLPPSSGAGRGALGLPRRALSHSGGGACVACGGGRPVPGASCCLFDCARDQNSRPHGGASEKDSSRRISHYGLPVTHKPPLPS